jgi:hypothetical protein
MLKAVNMDKPYKRIADDVQFITFMMTNEQTKNPTVVYMDTSGVMLSCTLPAFKAKFVEV